VQEVYQCKFESDITTWKFRAHIFSDDKDFLQGFVDSSPSKASTSSAAEVEDMLQQIRGSSRTPSLSRSSSAADLRHIPKYSITPSRNIPGTMDYNARVCLSLVFGEGPAPLPKLSGLSQVDRAYSFFNETIVDARRCSGKLSSLFWVAVLSTFLDVILMNHVFYNDKMGAIQGKTSLYDHTSKLTIFIRKPRPSPGLGPYAPSQGPPTI
jgi:hypothetical protein